MSLSLPLPWDVSPNAPLCPQPWHMPQEGRSFLSQHPHLRPWNSFSWNSFSCSGTHSCQGWLPRSCFLFVSVGSGLSNLAPWAVCSDPQQHLPSCPVASLPHSCLTSGLASAWPQPLPCPPALHRRPSMQVLTHFLTKWLWASNMAQLAASSLGTVGTDKASTSTTHSAATRRSAPWLLLGPQTLSVPQSLAAAPFCCHSSGDNWNKTQSFWVRLAQIGFCVYGYLTMRPWISCLTSLSLSFLYYNVGIVVALTL